MKNIFLGLGLVLLHALAWAQGSYTAESSYGIAGSYTIHQTKLDSLGNTYLVGSFNSDSLVVGGIILSNIDTFGNDAFVAKVDVNGQVLWAKNGGGKRATQGQDIAFAPNGDVYIVGTFIDTVFFGNDTLMPAADADWPSLESHLFLAQYDADGTYLKVTQYLTTGRNISGAGICNNNGTTCPVSKDDDIRYINRVLSTSIAIDYDGKLFVNVEFQGAFLGQVSRAKDYPNSQYICVGGNGCSTRTVFFNIHSYEEASSVLLCLNSSGGINWKYHDKVLVNSQLGLTENYVYETHENPVNDKVYLLVLNKSDGSYISRSLIDDDIQTIVNDLVTVNDSTVCLAGSFKGDFAGVQALGHYKGFTALVTNTGFVKSMNVVNGPSEIENVYLLGKKVYAIGQMLDSNIAIFANNQTQQFSSSNAAFFLKCNADNLVLTDWQVPINGDSVRVGNIIALGADEVIFNGFFKGNLPMMSALNDTKNAGFFGRYQYVKPVPPSKTLLRAEYFVDADPGVGNGTAIAMAPTDSIDTGFSFPVTSLSQGYHTIGVRVQDDAGLWSGYSTRHFYIMPSPSPLSINQSPIVAAEYFVDADPGVGKAIGFSINQGDTVDAGFAMPLTGLSQGYHTIGVRVKDSLGLWSGYLAKHFFIMPPAQATKQASPLVAAEYFIGADPGVGKGTAISIAKADSIAIHPSMPVGNLLSGDYTLSVRVKDSLHQWSGYRSEIFTICAVLPVADFKADTVEYGKSTSFTDKSTSTDSNTVYSWDYTNDGSVEDSTRNASFVYPSVGTFQAKLKVSNGNSCFTEILKTIVVKKATQNIVFDSIPVKTYGDADFSLSATGGASGKAIVFTSADPSIATISGNTLSILKAGVVNVTASQEGNDNYQSATAMTRSLTINKATQTINFAALPSKTFGDSDFSLTATGGASGKPVVFSSSDPTIASITGTTVKMLKAGTVNITASQAGDDNYEAATSITQSQTINKAMQTITFAALPSKTFGDADFSLTATGGSSGNPVVFTSTDPAIASITGTTVKILKAGTVSITASQAGDDNYEAATSITQSQTINKANQTISFAALPSKTFGDADFSLTATGGSSGNPVVFTSTDPTIASISSTTVTIIKAGMVDITARQAGDDNYLEATKTRSLLIDKAEQFIVFDSIPDKILGKDQPFDVTASSSKGLPISFSVTGPATMSGKKVTLTGEGTVVITASQLGNENYLAATNVQRTFKVDKAVGVEGIVADDTYVQVFPNPNNGNFTIRSQEKMVYHLVNVLGQTIQMVDLQDLEEITVSDIPAGLYYIKTEDGRLVSKFFVTK